MRQTTLPVLLAAFGLLLSSASADDKNLPQVLFLGDGLQGQFIQASQKDLKGKVQITTPRAPAAEDTGTALAQLDALLGDKHWDLIIFNYGIGDLAYKDPRTKQVRFMGKDVGGVLVTPPKQYEENLKRLASRLKATGSKLLWSQTTPLVNLQHRYRSFDENSEIPYNAIAARVMTEHAIPVLDLHAFILANMEDNEKHPAFNGYVKHLAKKKIVLHQPLTAAISAQLKLADSEEPAN